MSEFLNCDLVIIGAGSGGLSLASGASQLGLDVILIESGKMGGDCLNYGCIPSKSFIAAAKAFHQAKTSAHFGFRLKQAKPDFSKIMQHVHQTIEHISEHDSIERFESLGVRVIQGFGRFVDKDCVEVNQQQIKAKRFAIATGSSPFIPSIPGLDTVPYLSNETLFNLKEQPEHLIVIGGGPIGCELAQAFCMLGSKVSLVENFTILPKDDKDCVELIRQEMQAMQLDLHEQSKVLSIKKADLTKLTITIETEGATQALKGTDLLIATGRRPNLSGLDLEKAGVEFNQKGIIVNSHLQSSNKRIYAIGDVAGPFQFTHAANYQAGIVLRNIVFKLPAKVNYQAMPWVTFTEPELAHVGLLAEDALKQPNMQITESPLAATDRAQAEHRLNGKIKIISDKKGRIAGATIVAPEAGELILPWVMAIREKKSLRSFSDLIVPYPTMSEISKHVAGEFYKPKLFSKNVRCLVRWLQKLF